MSRKAYSVVGLMSGTSLDGLDIACCTISEEAGKWNANIEHATTIAYNHDWKSRLLAAPDMSGIELSTLHRQYGQFLGENVFTYLEETGFQADFVSSHGHTVFHQPEQAITMQVGSGAALAAASRLPAICDFRSLDVAMGGQGAPLVPIGDQLLFGNYDYCLNIGGFANVSYEEGGQRRAFDICPANILLNYLAGKMKRPFDDQGAIAAEGNLNAALLKELNALPFYAASGPKSLGREDVENDFLPIIYAHDISVPDKLRTVCEHIAEQIAKITVTAKNKTLLVTGGGAFNNFLIHRIKENTQLSIVLPNTTLINYKEAMIFAFLGTLRWCREINVLASVTGASQNHVGGAIYAPIPR